MKKAIFRKHLANKRSNFERKLRFNKKAQKEVFTNKSAYSVFDKPAEWSGHRVLSLWKPEQVQVFVEAADEMGYHSIGTLALLCFDLCERPGDMLDLTWHNYWHQQRHWKRRNITTRLIESVGQTTVGYFDFQCRKTYTEKHIPASTRLVERLKTTRKSALNNHIIYNDRNDMPMHVGQALSMCKKIQKYANLPDILRMGDLRRSGLKVAKLSKQVFEISEGAVQ